MYIKSRSNQLASPHLIGMSVLLSGSLKLLLNLGGILIVQFLREVLLSELRLFSNHSLRINSNLFWDRVTVYFRIQGEGAGGV